MDRININIRDDLTDYEALHKVLNAYSHGLAGTGHGIVTFDDNTAVSLRKTKAGNLTFTFFKQKE